MESGVVIDGQVHRDYEVNIACGTVQLQFSPKPYRDDMTALLSKAGSKLTVKQLLDTLQETMDFESSITRKFGTSVSYL